MYKNSPSQTNAAINQTEQNQSNRVSQSKIQSFDHYTSFEKLLLEFHNDVTLDDRTQNEVARLYNAMIVRDKRTNNYFKHNKICLSNM